MDENTLSFENKSEDLHGVDHAFFRDVQTLVEKFHQNVEKLAAHHAVKVDTKVLFKIVNLSGG